MKNLSKKQLIAFFSILLLIFIAIIFSLTSLIFRAGKIATTVKFAPFSATVSLNGTTIKNNAINYLLPGSYHLVVENEHFSTYQADIIINKDSHYIVGTLTASDKQGNEYFKKYRSHFTEAEGLAGKISVEAGNKIKKQYPILKYLPINNSLYSISYAYDNGSTPIINVKSSLKYLDAAILKLQSLKDVDLASYKINFKNENPYIPTQSSANTDPNNFIKESFNLDDRHLLGPNSKLSDDYYLFSIYSYDYSSDLKFAHYRILIKKNNQSWQLVSNPTPLFTKYNTKNVPDDILKKANNFSIY